MEQNFRISQFFTFLTKGLLHKKNISLNFYQFGHCSVHSCKIQTFFRSADTNNGKTRVFLINHAASKICNKIADLLRNSAIDKLLQKVNCENRNFFYRILPQRTFSPNESPIV